jgi:hypothetical protein
MSVSVKGGGHPFAALAVGSRGVGKRKTLAETGRSQLEQFALTSQENYVGTRHRAFRLVTLMLAMYSLGSCSRESTIAERPVATHVLIEEWRTSSQALSGSGVFDAQSSATDALGRLYIGGIRNEHVLVLSIEGEMVRTLGRKGHGPGEFVAISDVQVFRDTVWILDSSLGRVERFDTAGRYLGTTTPPPHAPGRLAGISAAGGLWFLRQSDQLTSDGLPLLDIVATDAADRVHLAVPGIRLGRRVRSSGGFNTLDPSTPIGFYDVSNGILGAISQPDSNAIAFRAERNLVARLYGANATVLRSVDYSANWSEITPEERQAYYEWQVSQAREDTKARLGRQLRRVLPLEGINPPVSGVIVGRDSSLWIAGPSIGRDSVEWLAWRWVQEQPIRIYLPAGWRILAPAYESAWVAARGPDDADIVMFMRLEAATFLTDSSESR